MIFSAPNTTPSLHRSPITVLVFHRRDEPLPLPAVDIFGLT